MPLVWRRRFFFLGNDSRGSPLSAFKSLLLQRRMGGDEEESDGDVVWPDTVRTPTE